MKNNSVNRESSRSQVSILGLDVALRKTGYGIIDSNGQEFKVIDCGLISTPQKAPLSECLRRLHRGVGEMVSEYAPQMTGIESGFFYKNAKTAMLLGSARGAVMGPIAEAGIPIYEYSPRRIKQAVCGYGNADKKQIARLVGQMLSLNTEEMSDDVTDALGIAICHAHTYFTNQGTFLPEPV